MPKLCIYEGCKNNRFGGKYCRYHQYKRENRSNTLGKTNKLSIKKFSVKRQRENAKILGTVKKDHEFYYEIWCEREHIDFETGEPIYGEPLTLYFHHCLPKKKYPKLRHAKENIVLISWQTHTKAENNLDLVPKIREYTNQLLKKYT